MTLYSGNKVINNKTTLILQLCCLFKKKISYRMFHAAVKCNKSLAVVQRHISEFYMTLYSGNKVTNNKDHSHPVTILFFAKESLSTYNISCADVQLYS